MKKKEAPLSRNRDNAFLKQLAQDIYQGKVFTDRHVQNAQDLHMVFMILALGGVSKKVAEHVGMVYEYLDKRGPMAINGYPTFFSCNLLNKHDTKVVWDIFFEIKKSVEGVQVKQEPLRR